MLTTAVAPVVEQMIKQQVRAWNVNDQTVLDALAQTPREPFLPASLRAIACADVPLALGPGRQMLAPNVEGKILVAIQPGATDHALVIGADNAHFAAALARMAAKVTLMDADPVALELARQQIVALGLNNVFVQVGTLADFAHAANYELIVVTGSLPALPEKLRQGLKPGGRLFVVLGSEPVMEAVLVTRSEQGWQQQALFETVLPILAGINRPAEFQF